MTERATAAADNHQLVPLPPFVSMTPNGSFTASLALFDGLREGYTEGKPDGKEGDTDDDKCGDGIKVHDGATLGIETLELGVTVLDTT